MGKSEFLTPLDVRVLKANVYPGSYQLLNQLVYYSALMNQQIVIPAGFVCDFASIPKEVLNIPGFIGHHAAVVHDYLVSHWPLHKRKLADSVFYEALIAMDVEANMALTMYHAVQMYTDHLRTQEFLDEDERYVG